MNSFCKALCDNNNNNINKMAVLLQVNSCRRKQQPEKDTGAQLLEDEGNFLLAFEALKINKMRAGQTKWRQFGQYTC